MAYADIGKSVKELFDGGRSGGAFQFDPMVTGSSKTSTGVALTTTVTLKGDKVVPVLKAAYSTKKYSVDASCDSSATVKVNASLSELAPGVKITASGVLPDPKSGKLGLEHSIPHLNYKIGLGLTKAPVIDLTAATKFSRYIVGGEVTYDSAKDAPITKYAAGVGYNAPDFQAAAVFSEVTEKVKKAADDKSTADSTVQNRSIKVGYYHTINPTHSVGAEIIRSLATNATTFQVGYSRNLANGSIAKVKLANSGLASMMYESKLAGGEKVSGSFQCNVTELSKPVKYGFSLDLF